MAKKKVVITKNVLQMQEALGGPRVYLKVCTGCNVGVRTRRRTFRTCARCGERLRKATPEEAKTAFQG
jgi:rRNA maturation endonuclease Nob1